VKRTRISLPVLRLRLNPLCVTSVCLGRVPVTGPLTALATVPLSVLHQNCLGEGALSGHGDPRVSGVAETWPTRDWAPAFVRPARVTTGSLIRGTRLRAAFDA
jgi:hypothetical protein